MKSFFVCAALALVGCAAEPADHPTSTSSASIEDRGDVEDLRAEVDHGATPEATCTFSNCVSQCQCFERLCRAEGGPPARCLMEFTDCTTDC